MKFMDAVKSVFGKYATFSGRARRSEYWYFVLFNGLIGLALGFLGSFLGTLLRSDGVTTFFTVLSSIYSLAVLVPSLAVGVRRLHDIGKAGTNWLFILIPLVGAILLLVWFAQAGQIGPNQYGPDPKGNSNPYNQYNQY